MPRHCVKVNVRASKDTDVTSGWEVAARDAEAMLEKAKLYVRRLELAVMTFRENAKNQLPWPDGGFLCRDKTSCARKAKCAKPFLIAEISAFRKSVVRFRTPKF